MRQSKASSGPGGVARTARQVYTIPSSTPVQLEARSKLTLRTRVQPSRDSLAQQALFKQGILGWLVDVVGAPQFPSVFIQRPMLGPSLMSVTLHIPAHLQPQLEAACAPGTITLPAPWQAPAELIWVGRPRQVTVRLVQVPAGLSVSAAQDLMTAAGCVVTEARRPVDVDSCLPVSDAITLRVQAGPSRQLPAAIAFTDTDGHNHTMRLDILSSLPPAPQAPPSPSAPAPKPGLMEGGAKSHASSPPRAASTTTRPPPILSQQGQPHPQPQAQQQAQQVQRVQPNGPSQSALPKDAQPSPAAAAPQLSTLATTAQPTQEQQGQAIAPPSPSSPSYKAALSPSQGQLSAPPSAAEEAQPCPIHPDSQLAGSKHYRAEQEWQEVLPRRGRQQRPRSRSPTHPSFPTAGPQP